MLLEIIQSMKGNHKVETKKGFVEFTSGVLDGIRDHILESSGAERAEVCDVCRTTKHWPTYASVSRGQAGMKMYGGSRGYRITDEHGNFVTLHSYTLWDCHECGRNYAANWMRLKNIKGKIDLVRFEHVDGIGNVFEKIEDVSSDYKDYCVKAGAKKRK